MLLKRCSFGSSDRYEHNLTREGVLKKQISGSKLVKFTFGIVNFSINFITWRTECVQYDRICRLLAPPDERFNQTDQVKADSKFPRFIHQNS